MIPLKGHFFKEECDIKINRILATVPPDAWWLSDKIEAHQKKKRAKRDADVIDNIERLHRLNERGIINEKDFEELKEKFKERI